MATIRQRNGKWQAQVRHRGQPTLSRTFNLRADAVRWSKQTEAEVDRLGVSPDRSILRRLSLGDLLRRFRDEVCPNRRGQSVETFTINGFLRSDLASKWLAEITPEGFAAYRDQRLKLVRAGTVNRELGLIQRIWEVAKVEWGIPLPENPMKSISKPKADKPRERRLRAGEWDRLVEASRESRNPFLLPLVQLALATGMRRGELLNAHWGDLNWTASTLHIPWSKTGEPRTIPLSGQAKRLLAGLGVIWSSDDRVIPISTEAAKLSWQRLTRRAGIEDLRFHDLRHEAVSRFFELGLTVPEVALISGHKDPRMLFRYTHLRAADVAKKIHAIDRITAESESGGEGAAGRR